MSKDFLTLSDVGEDALLARLLGLVPSAPPPIGPGDDCAVLDLSPALPQVLLLKTDAIACGVHFLPTSPAREVGRKAAGRVISDIAAMGGMPTQFLVTIALAPETRLEWVEQLYLGIRDQLIPCGAALAGGETLSLPAGAPAVISVAGLGLADRAAVVTRGGACVGDGIWVTGRLGGSLAGKHLQFTPRWREAQWLIEHLKPRAMMDLSDGLGKDLPRLAAASKVGYRLDMDHIPCTPGSTVDQAISDGEDYELLLVLPKRSDADKAELLAAWSAQFPELELSCIGEITPIGTGDELHGGWEHFTKPARG